MNHPSDHPDDRQLWRKYRQAVARPQRAHACPDANAVAAYLDERLSAAQIDEVEGHLTECETCLAAVAHGRELLTAAPMVAPGSLVARATELVKPSQRVHRLRFMVAARWTAVAAMVMATGYLGFHTGIITGQPAPAATVASTGNPDVLNVLAGMGEDEELASADNDVFSALAGNGGVR